MRASSHYILRRWSTTRINTIFMTRAWIMKHFSFVLILVCLQLNVKKMFAHFSCFQRQRRHWLVLFLHIIYVRMTTCAAPKMRAHCAFRSQLFNCLRPIDSCALLCPSTAICSLCSVWTRSAQMPRIRPRRVGAMGRDDFIFRNVKAASSDLTTGDSKSNVLQYVWRPSETKWPQSRRTRLECFVDRNRFIYHSIRDDSSKPFKR